jgi:peptidoglycan hydrolase-like protein with peptidoglycan-binding domain
MRDGLEKKARERRVVPAAAWSLAAILALAIAGNAMFGQERRPIMAQTGAEDGAMAAADQAVPQVGARTIQLKYDPVVEAVQRELIATGYYKGPVDGVNGRKTRQAITAYQQAVGLPPDGKATSDLAEHIRFTRQVAEASLFTGSIAAAPDAEVRAAIRRVQAGLADLGFSPGEINGELTRQTRDAIIAFQQARKMPETGEIDNALVTELDRATALSEPASP